MAMVVNESSLVGRFRSSGQQDNRTAVAFMALTRENPATGSTTGSQVTAESDGRVVQPGRSPTSVDVNVFGDDGSGPGVVESTTDTAVEPQIETPAQAKIAQPDVTCYGCTSIVGIACAGAATLSVASCSNAAVASGVFSPWAGGAVAAFCLYIVANAGTLTCSAGTLAICGGAGFCEVVE